MPNHCLYLFSYYALSSCGGNCHGSREDSAKRDILVSHALDVLTFLTTQISKLGELRVKKGNQNKQTSKKITCKSMSTCMCKAE